MSLLMVVCELASPVLIVVLPPVLPEAELSPVSLVEVTLVSVLAVLVWSVVVEDESDTVTLFCESEPLPLTVMLTSAEAGLAANKIVMSKVVTVTSRRLVMVSICMVKACVWLFVSFWEL